MERRDFLKTSAAAAGLATSQQLLPPLAAAENNFQDASGISSSSAEENRSADFIRRVQQNGFLPKPPVIPDSIQAGDVRIAPMPLSERIRRGIVPRRGLCSLAPGNGALLCGNGPVNVELAGHPFTEQIAFRHESLFPPRARPFEAPRIADIFPQVRQMVLEGKYHEAAEFAYQKWHQLWDVPAMPGGRMGRGGFSINLELPKSESVKDFLRTVDFESTEVKVHWTDERGDWVRRIFASRPDNVVVQWLTAPETQSVNVRIAVSAGGGGRGGFGAGRPGGGGEAGNAQTDCTEERLIYKGRLAPSVDNRGFAGVTRIVRDGGSARMEGSTVVVENAASVILLTRIAYFPDYSEDEVEAAWQALQHVTPDYPALLERARQVQSEMLNRVTVDFGGASKHGLTSEELLSDQRCSPGYSGAFLERLFEMCRYWFILNSGKYCSMAALTNANINLQLAPMASGYHREGEQAYFNWMESLVPDFRTNARNIYGMRGVHYAISPTADSGVNTQFDHADSTGETWPHPYWLSGGGWCVRPFWDHYQVTGDLDFLRQRVVPAYQDLALFYEDFLSVTDQTGHYVFAPGFSPENHPGNLDSSQMLVLNATMDIAVCREVLTNLVEACETLGIEAGSVPKWKAMLAKLPPYLLEPDGTLKEWAWPTLEERHNQRHVSHLYGAWPGDEIDPDRTPRLAMAMLLANRHRVPERLAAHSRCHRALVGARLKDAYIVDSELRQLVEEGYVGPTLQCAHDPYAFPMPDAQGGIPAIMMEMLAYSRPGVVEVLPALPPSLVKGSITGMLLRTFARLDQLTWDMEARTVALKITSVRPQDVTLIARHGIEDLAAPADVLAAKRPTGAATCDLHLPGGEPVEIKLKLGRRNPLDWAQWVRSDGNKA